MAGIAAIFAKGPVQARLIATGDVLARDPHDTRSEWTGGPMALCACTYPATAEAREVSQPHTAEDNELAAVFDGYLTNYQELRRDLLDRGAVLRNRSDEELVLRAYEQWGEDCSIRIEGEFAFVVADLRRQTMFCARDHQGLRPLFYYEDDDTFVAASSIAAVLEALEELPEPDYDFLAEVMIGEVYSIDRTAWKGVRRLNAAHCLSRNPDGPSKLRRYYSLPSVSITSFRSDEEYIEEYRDVLADAVRRTSRTHLPLAIEVSGGQDSSSIYSLAHHLMGQGGLPAPSIGAYSLRGTPGTASDEIEYARAVTDFTGTQLHESELFRPDLDWFDSQAASERDLPTYTNAAQSILLERQMAEAGSRVVLNGMGGDQWLDGSYGYYHQAIRARNPRRFVKNLRRDISYYGVRSSVPFALRKLALASLPEGLRSKVRQSRADFGRLMYEDVLYISDVYAEKAHAAKRAYLCQLPVDEVAGPNVVRLDSLQNQRAFDLMHRQRARIGLEGRSPMFTRQFIEFCNSIPEDLKYRAGRTKWVHREAMRGLMSDRIIERDTKATFPERRHDLEIPTLCESERKGVLAPLVDDRRFKAFCDLRSDGEIDDSHDWAYWSCYTVVSFLRNYAKP